MISPDGNTTDAPKDKGFPTRRFAIFLTFAGALPPLTPFVAWAHKFYLGQYVWGVVYLALAATPLTKIVWIACALEGAWYLTQSDEHFRARFPAAGTALLAVSELVEKEYRGAEDGDGAGTLASSLLDSSSVARTMTNNLTHQLSKLTKSPAEKEADVAQAASQMATALRDLDRLREDGLMTEYEFEQKRRKLLENVR
ncbi:MAG: SHOCT domain-containing protein [Cyanobacteria bacterium J06635_11]